MRKPETVVFFQADRSSRPNPKERVLAPAILSRARASQVSIDPKDHFKIGYCLAIAGPVARRDTGRQNVLCARVLKMQVQVIRKLLPAP
jgi:hypothetical protein